MNPFSKEFWSVFARFGLPGLALAVFFTLYQKFDWEIGMIPSNWAGPLAALFLVLTFLIAVLALLRPRFIHPEKRDYPYDVRKSIARKVLAEIENHRIVYQCPGMAKGCPEGALTSVQALRRAIQIELKTLVELNEMELSAILNRMNEAARKYASYSCKGCDPDLGECANCTLKHEGCVPALKKYQKDMKGAMTDMAKLVQINIPETISQNSFWLAQV